MGKKNRYDQYLESFVDQTMMDMEITVPTEISINWPPMTLEQLKGTGAPVNFASGGPSNTPPPRPNMTVNITTTEKPIFGCDGHAAIIMGQQRGTPASGQGAPGFPSETIDIVVGFNAGTAKRKNDEKVVNINPVSDAARIYISRSVQVDTMFGIAREAKGDEEKKEKPASAVVMKADKARIIGREGVKIITGHAQGAKGAGSTGERNAGGGKYEQAATIDLIAGNNIGSHEISMPKAAKPFLDLIKDIFPNWDGKQDYLQPVVRGHNLITALDGLEGEIQAMLDAQGLLMTYLLTFVSTLAIAASPIPGAGQAIGTACGSLAVPVANLLGRNQPAKNSMMAWQANYLNPNGSLSILSRNVRAT